ncbi:MAG: CHAT domain-containing protein [Cyanobacteria bacterium J06598_3]
MQLGQPEAAFETSEASRARVLIELLNEANVDIRQGVDPTLLTQEQSLRDQIRQLEARRIDLRSGQHTQAQANALDQQSNAQLQQLDQVLSQIRRSSPAYAETVQPQPLSLAQIQQQVLDTDTVLVQYALGQEKSYLWLIGKNNFEVHTLPGQETIQLTAQQFKSALSYRSSLSNIKTTGNALAAQILPERPDWMTDKRLLIAGDGILAELPFAALPLPNQAEYTPLLTEHEILSQPSITAVSILRKQLANRARRPSSLAVLADPVYRTDDERLQQRAPVSERPTATERNLRDLDLRAIERLPYTRQEAENILTLAANNNLKSISALDFNATAAWVSSPEVQQQSILHLATHGFINPTNPQLSGIVLSLVERNGQLNENGFLRLHDIFNLTLAAELVILSACQTGQGQNISGEGNAEVVTGGGLAKGVF